MLCYASICRCKSPTRNHKVFIKCSRSENSMNHILTRELTNTFITVLTKKFTYQITQKNTYRLQVIAAHNQHTRSSEVHLEFTNKINTSKTHTHEVCDVYIYIYLFISMNIYHPCNRLMRKLFTGVEITACYFVVI